MLKLSGPYVISFEHYFFWSFFVNALLARNVSSNTFLAALEYMCLTYVNWNLELLLVSTPNTPVTSYLLELYYAHKIKFTEVTEFIFIVFNSQKYKTFFKLFQILYIIVVQFENGMLMARTAIILTKTKKTSQSFKYCNA